MTDIAINPVARRAQFTGNTGTGPFAFTFNILADADIAVYKNTTLLTLTTDYTISTNANGTGSVTLTGSNNGTALVASDVLTIIGGRNLSRTTDFVTAGDLLASSLNEQLDSIVVMAQQLDEKLTRSVKVNPGDVFTDLELPLKDARKGTVLGFNATSGDPEPGPTIADTQALAAITADIATLADIEDGTDATDAIQTAASNSSNITTVAGISGNVTTVAGIASNVTSVAGNATNVNTVAGSIANVNTTASNISSVNTNATNISAIQGASGNASTASTKASEAATSATGAAASATSAATAQTAAEAARDSALAAFDNFDDKYLGAKSSAPTVDNDGDALVSGALYYDTTANAMQVYTGSAWVAAYASLSGALLVTNNLSDLNSAANAATNLGLGTGDSPTFAGLNTTANMNFADYTVANFGANNDLQITSQNTWTLIQNNAGNLVIRNSVNDGDVTIHSDNGSGNYAAYVKADGSTGEAILYHYGSEKLATKSTGVDVTGSLRVAKTSAALADVGHEFNNEGYAYHTRDNNTVLYLNRKTSDGELVIFHKDGNDKGDIRNNGNDFIFKARSSVGKAEIQTHDGNEKIALDPSGYIKFEAAGSERLRIDTSGHLLVGKTASTGATAGCELRESGFGLFTRSGGNPLQVRRLSDNGSLVDFYKDTTHAGGISYTGSHLVLYSGSAYTGIGGNATSPYYWAHSSALYPTADNTRDLGTSGNRYDDVYATNGTINTSDINEKQDIEELSDTEQRVAVACKGLLRKFRWKDSVAEKGEEARIHFGIMAQDLQSAFEAEGLDAGDYAMFISTTWTDEETGEERTRLGVRYSELLAFIIGAL